jgi:hypothetical protein
MQQELGELEGAGGDGGGAGLEAGSSPTTFSQCQRIMPAQEPEGTTMG